MLNRAAIHITVTSVSARSRPRSSFCQRHPLLALPDPFPSTAAPSTLRAVSAPPFHVRCQPFLPVMLHAHLARIEFIGDGQPLNQKVTIQATSRLAVLNSLKSERSALLAAAAPNRAVHRRVKGGWLGFMARACYVQETPPASRQSCQSPRGPCVRCRAQSND